MLLSHQHPCLADDVRVTAAYGNMSRDIWVSSWLSHYEKEGKMIDTQTEKVLGIFVNTV